MSNTIDFFNTIVILGVIQGILSAIAVGYYSSPVFSKKLLSAILLTLAFLGIKILLHTLGLWQHPNLHYFPLAIDTLIQPLFYLYICCLTEEKFSFKQKTLWHFAPVLIFQVHAILVYIVTLSQTNIHSKDHIAEQYLYYNAVKWIEDILVLFSSGIYWYLSFQKVQKYRHWLFTSQSATQYSELKWLRNLLFGTGLLITVLFLSSLPANILQYKNSFPYLQIFYGYLTILIYFLSFQGYHTLLASKMQVFRMPQKSISEIDLPDIEIKTIENQENFQDILSALTEVMEKQFLFMEPELNLKDLSRPIGFPTSQVSSVINTGFGLNFRGWVNSYRVEEVKKRLNDPAYKQLSLTGIAYECGFNSEASFYRIFRQHTGYSPKTYLQKLKSRH
ncbi:helix-turn-helix domain-containing protein [Chryseobacterium sp. PMSZPI]|uniref:helix-turn-helix domain-containing protein n=1 Tax=Chryseobacterium sp. PMSZPI TaxID=1033900 RepID=UPI000C331D07|nr:AraC family transcriptional regulator [Chryseobacterium sp. PMSZPI]PKF74905.1 AraC family transcriptional regulator [Chryseobacterium sp. PMSZPI]